MTPEELEKQRQQEQAKREQFKRRIKLATSIATAGGAIAVSQIKGLDKINQTINDKVASLQSKAIDQLLVLASDLGIEGLETGIPTLPNLCPPAALLDKALVIRNNLGDSINTTAAYINIVNASLRIISDLLNGTITTLTALNLLKTVTSVGVKVIPPGAVPGAITALLADLDDARTLLTFKTDGTPKLPELKRAVEIGSTYINQAAITLSTIVTLLDFVDQILIKCGKNPDNIGDQIDTLLATKKAEDTTYKGFTFRIIEKPFSPTVSQKIGQALNKEGIVLLQTEPSFTLDPQVLIEELKLIIDRDNLTADPYTLNDISQSINNPPPPTTKQTPTNPAVNQDVTPLGYAGKVVGEKGNLPVGNGSFEEVYQWTGDKWVYVETISI
jgi:hypothetical protein